MFWLLLAAFLIICVYFALVKRFSYWKERGVAEYSVYVILRETFLSICMRQSLAEQLQMIYNDFSGRRYCGSYQFLRPVLVIRDSDLIKQLLVKDFDHFVDHMKFFEDDSEPIWGRNLLVLRGDKWRNVRAATNPSFSGSKMRVIFDIMSETATQFVKYLEEKNSGTITLDMQDAFTRFTNDVIASSAFGISCDSMKDPNNTFYLLGKDLTNIRKVSKALRFFFVLMAPKLAKFLGVSIFEKRVTEYFSEIVMDNIRTRERDGIVRRDMIHLLMEAKKKKSKITEATENCPDESVDKVDEVKREDAQLTDLDIVAQAILFFFAGFAPVAGLLCLVSHELAINPDIQERLQREVDDTLNECDGTLTYEALSKMKYMDMVVSETLRKWPVAVIADRMCTKPYTIPPVNDDEKPVHLNKGDLITVPIFGFHRDPNLYPDPERFDPERFSEENKSKLDPYAYLPFGAGPRICIGRRFALMETKLVLFYVLSKFDIVVVDKTVIPLRLAKSPFQLVIDDSFWLGLRKRNV